MNTKEYNQRLKTEDFYHSGGNLFIQSYIAGAVVTLLGIIFLAMVAVGIIFFF